MSRLRGLLARGQQMLKGFTPGQRAIVAVSVVALGLAAWGLAQWASQPSWTPLFSGLSGSQASAIVTQLDSDGVQYKLSDGGGTIMVPQAKVYALRIEMAGKNLITSDSDTSWSVFDGQSITSTELQANVAYQRAVESELQKTLQAISGVQTAIVHIAVPTKDVFATAQDKTTASVLLQLASGVSLSSSQVQAVTRLVAGAVPDLDPANVTLTDQNGELLTADGVSAGSSGDRDSQTAAKEARLAEQAQTVLDKVLGPGHAVVKVNADVNYDSTTQVKDQYSNPSPTVNPTAWQTSVELYNNGVNSTGGPLGQTWPTLSAAAGSSGTGGYGKWEGTGNQPVDRTLSTATIAPGQITRLSVAVVLDQAKAAQLNVSQVQQLVGNAVGLQVARGDQIVVNTMAFDTTAAATAAKELAATQQAARLGSYLDLGKKVGLGLLVLVAALLFFRRRRRGDVIETSATDLRYEQLQALAAAQQSALTVPADFAVSLTSTAEDEAANARMREEVAALVKNQPEDVAMLIEGWLTDRKG